MRATSWSHSCRSLQMKDFCASLPVSGADSERYLLESIPEEDQAALLPIIKMAFPIIESGRPQPFRPSEVALNMHTRHSIMEMTDCQHKLPLSKQPFSNANDQSQMDELLCVSNAAHGFNGIQHTTVQSFVPPPPMSAHKVARVPEKAAPEESFIAKDDKLLLSLGAARSESCLQLDAYIKDLLDYTSSEYYWLQKQESTCGEHSFPESALDLNSCTSCKSSESSIVHGGSVMEVMKKYGDSNKSPSLANNKRKSVSSCWKDHDVKSKKVQFSSQSVTEDVKASLGAKTGCSEGSLSESRLFMRECVDKRAEMHAADSATVDAPMKQHKLERCRRSNGKQWRCAKNAAPGTMYCELHHKYRSKSRIKRSLSPAKACHLEQKRAAFLKEKQVNVARCRRTDGKLWQCSKQAMPGSFYCDHHKRYKKSKKQLKGASSVAVENRSAVKERHATPPKEENGLDEASVCNSIKSDGLIQLCNLLAKERELELRVFGGVGEKELEANSNGTLEGKHEGGLVKHSIQIVHMEDMAGLVSINDGQKQDRVEPVPEFKCLVTFEGKNAVNDIDQCIEKDASREASCASMEDSGVDALHAGGSTWSAVEPQSNEDRGFVPCHQNMARRSVSKPSSPYHEHWQPTKLEAKDMKQGKGHKLRIPIQGASSPNEDRGDQTQDGVDDSCVGMTYHNGQWHESDQLNNMILREVHSLKQCQRKDGKGWQCSKDAKQGHNYCLHHLEYVSKRKSNYRCENEGRSSAMSLPKEASATIPVVQSQGLSAGGSVEKDFLDDLVGSVADPLNAIFKHGHPFHSEGAEAVPHDSNLADSNACCERVHSSHMLGVAINLQGSTGVNESTQKQEDCASVSYPLLREINPSQDMSEQETSICSDNSTFWCEHVMVGAPIFGRNDENHVAGDSSLRIMCGEVSLQELKSTSEKSRAPCTLVNVGCYACIACDKEQNAHQLKRINGSVLEGGFWKQCQRKDGKGWQCSKSAKQGQNYCAHHLVYLRNRRNTFKLCRKATHQPTSEDGGAVLTATGLCVDSNLSPPASPSIVPEEGLSARKLSAQSGMDSTHNVHNSLAESKSSTPRTCQ